MTYSKNNFGDFYTRFDFGMPDHIAKNKKRRYVAPYTRGCKVCKQFRLLYNGKFEMKTRKFTCKECLDKAKELPK
jgi:hypothetical protein